MTENRYAGNLFVDEKCDLKKFQTCLSNRADSGVEKREPVCCLESTHFNLQCPNKSNDSEETESRDFCGQNLKDSAQFPGREHDQLVKQTAQQTFGLADEHKTGEKSLGFLEGLGSRYLEDRFCDFNNHYTEFDLRTCNPPVSINYSTETNKESDGGPILIETIGRSKVGPEKYSLDEFFSSHPENTNGSPKESDREFKYFDIKTPPESDVPPLKMTNDFESSHLISRSLQENSVKKILMDLIQNMLSDNKESSNTSFIEKVGTSDIRENISDNPKSQSPKTMKVDFIPAEDMKPWVYLNPSTPGSRYISSDASCALDSRYISSDASCALGNAVSFVSLNNKNLFEAKNNSKAPKTDLEYYDYQKDEFVDFDSLNKNESLDPAKELPLDDDQEIANYGKYCPYFSQVHTDNYIEEDCKKEPKDCFQKLSDRYFDLRSIGVKNSFTESNFDQVDQEYYDKVYSNSETHKFNVIESSIYEHYIKEKTLSTNIKELRLQKEKHISEIEKKYKTQMDLLQKQHQKENKRYNNEISLFLKKITDWVSELEQLNKKMTALRFIMKVQSDTNKFDVPEIKKLVESRNSENKKMMEKFLAESDEVIKNILKYRSFTGFDIVVCRNTSLKIEKLIIENNNLGSTK
jgi:hypothetical protein